EGIKEAMVVAREEESGLKQLCAYYVSDNALSVTRLREQLSRELPGYMVPSYFVPLEQMPLTSNGKIDRRALPEPKASLQQTAQYIPPGNELESKLVNLWQDVLGLDRVGIRHNFFDLGGNSIRATALAVRIQKELSADITLKEIFKFPTIEELARIASDAKPKSYEPIQAAKPMSHYPVSSAQKRMYILSHMEGGELSYNMTGAMRMEGPLKLKRLNYTFQKLIDRHESLRTGFELNGGEPVQRIYPAVEFHIERVKAKEEEVEGLVRHFMKEFDLKKPPLMRAALIELDPVKHILLVDMHHIISDGASMNILIKEFGQLYEGQELMPLSIQYKDFSVWQQSDIWKGNIQSQEAYWLNMYKGEIPVLDMPTDYERPSIRQYEGESFEFSLAHELSKQLRVMEESTGSTLYMILFAAYTILLSKYSGQEDLVVGTPVAGRTHLDLEPVVGMFVNTLAIRSYPEGSKTFHEYLHEVKETMIHAYQNQDYPLEELIQNIKLKKDASRNPLFDTMFVLQNMEKGDFKTDSLTITPYIQNLTVTKFDLTLSIQTERNEHQAMFEYSKTLFKKSRIEALAKDFLLILANICQNPNIQIQHIDLGGNASEEDTAIDSLQLNF
ncbi:condensation domain-containing protein, partial [Paenibacillus larvae]